MDIFSPSGIILRSLINKTLKIRIPSFSISFFSKVVQWLIEQYSTEATIGLAMCSRICRVNITITGIHNILQFFTAVYSILFR